jgi:malate dehydrogenase (oxaloacetate-decarboxylating)
MAIAAAEELAESAREAGLKEEAIVPTMDQAEVVPRVAAAVGVAAQEQRVAGLSAGHEELIAAATERIHSAREATHLLMREGPIAAPE